MVDLRDSKATPLILTEKEWKLLRKGKVAWKMVNKQWFRIFPPQDNKIMKMIERIAKTRQGKKLLTDYVTKNGKE